MIQIIKNMDMKEFSSSSEYSLYVNNTAVIDFEHIREKEDLAQLLRDAADALDIANGVTQPEQPKKKHPKAPWLNVIG